MYPRFRPHLKHRRTTRLLNFGTRSARAMIDFFAIIMSLELLVVGLKDGLTENVVTHASVRTTQKSLSAEHPRMMLWSARLPLHHSDIKKSMRISLRGRIYQFKAGKSIKKALCSFLHQGLSFPTSPAARRNQRDHPSKTSYSAFCNGKPTCRNRASASAFVLAVVTMVTANPKTSLSSSSDVSGKIVCSGIPIV